MNVTKKGMELGTCNHEVGPWVTFHPAEFEDTMPQYMEKCKIIPSGLHVCQQQILLWSFQALFLGHV